MTARAVDECIAYAASRTPAGVRSLVLGCTHYGLVVDRIVAALGREVTIHDSPVAVARQTLRRIGLEPHPTAPEGGVEAVLLSGRAGALPTSWGSYPAGAASSPRRLRFDRPERAGVTASGSGKPASFRPLDPQP